MPVITTIGAMSARGFGFAGGAGAGYWWVGFDNFVPSAVAYVQLDSSLQPVIMASTSGSSIYLAKLSQSGSVIWQFKTYSSLVDLSAPLGPPVFDGSDNFYYRALLDDGALNNSLLKQTADGSSVSARYANNVGAAASYQDAVLDGSGNIYFASLFSITKLNSSLVAQWTNQLVNVLPTPTIFVDFHGLGYDGTYLYSSGTNGARIAVSKWSTAGVLQWANFFSSGAASVTVNGLHVDGSGNSYICGSYNSDAFVMKINTSGSLVWQKVLTGSGGTFGTIAVDNSNFVYASGHCGAGGLIAQYDSNGALQWQRSLSLTVNTVLDSIAVEPDGTAFVVTISDPSTAIARLPKDGTHTGTYGALTYAVSSYTNSNLSESASASGYLTNPITPTTLTPATTTSATTAVATKTAM